MNTRRKLLFGVGVNDADYRVAINEKIGGVSVQTWRCPYYSRWKSMLERCYSEKYHKLYPTYKGCYVEESWLLFSNFRKWMVLQPWQGMVLDKDLLGDNMKLYCEAICVFIDKKVNGFLTDNRASRGTYLLGVTVYKGSNRWCASCRNPFEQKTGYIGLFDTEKSAHLAWKKQKNIYSQELAVSEYVTDQRVKAALVARYNRFTEIEDHLK